MARRYKKRKELPDSVLKHVLLALIPYTEANLKLAFKPGAFFNDLEKISNKKRLSIRNSYYRAQHEGLIEKDELGIPRLTDKGRLKIESYKPALLENAQLMIMFDIPESDRWKRDRLRLLLRELSFQQVQKSVWVTKYDCREYIKAEIEEMGLQYFVKLYEAKQL